MNSSSECGANKARTGSVQPSLACLHAHQSRLVPHDVRDRCQLRAAIAKHGAVKCNTASLADGRRGQLTELV